MVYTSCNMLFTNFSTTNSFNNQNGNIIEDSKYLIDIFKSSIELCLLNEKNSISDIFAIVEKFRDQKKFNFDQINLLTAISIDAFPLAKNSLFRSKLIRFICSEDQKNIYGLLKLVKEVNSLVHIKDCLSFMSSQTGIIFSADEPSSVMICLTSNMRNFLIIDEQIFTIIGIFNKNVSLRISSHVPNQLNWSRWISGFRLPLIVMNNNLEWGYMTLALKTIGSLLDNNQGFGMGESHTHHAPKDFLIDNMEYLKRKGVRKIALEFFVDEMQPYLDYYHNTGIFLKKLLEEINKMFCNHGIKKLLESSRKHNIRIIGIDKTELRMSLKECTYENLAERSMKMNPYAAKIIKNNVSSFSPEKFVALMGADHLFETYPGIPGICNILKCPAVTIVDANSNLENFNFKNVDIQIAYSSVLA